MMEISEHIAFAFKYLRADRQEVELGPFSQDTAQKKRERMEEFGAQCSNVYPVKVSPEEYTRLQVERESYVAGKVAEFKKYLSAELNVLDAVHSYNIIYNYINSLRGRISEFLEQETPGVPPNVYLAEVEAKFALYRAEYLLEISQELARRFSHYSPMDGSVPEDIGNLLQELSKEILSSIKQ